MTIARNFEKYFLLPIDLQFELRSKDKRSFKFLDKYLETTRKLIGKIL